MRTLLACLLVASCWVSQASWGAHLEFRKVYSLVTIEPMEALKSNLRAYEAFRWDSAVRRQLGLTLQAVARHYHPRVGIDPTAADMAYEVGLTVSPYSPAIHLARVEYLLNSNRWQGPEIGPLLLTRQETAKLQPGVWLASAHYAARVGRRDLALEAIERGAAVADEPFFVGEFTRLSALLEAS